MVWAETMMLSCGVRVRKALGSAGTPNGLAYLPNA